MDEVIVTVVWKEAEVPPEEPPEEPPVLPPIDIVGWWSALSGLQKVLAVLCVAVSTIGIFTVVKKESEVMEKEPEVMKE